ACSTSDHGADGPVAGSSHQLSGHTSTPGTASWAAWPQAMHDAQHSGASTSVGPQSAHLRWRRHLEGNITPGPVVGADGTIYVSSNAGVLHAIDPKDGSDRWTLDELESYGLDLSTSPAVLPNGLILWPGPGGALIGVTPDGHAAWRLQLGGLVTSPAVRADGTVAVGTDSGLLVGLQPTLIAPREQWRANLDEQSYGSAVFAASGDVVYQSVTSGVVAVENGEVLWRAKPADEIIEVSAAVGPDGTVVVGSNDDRVYGLHPEDGSVRWSHDLGYTTYSSPGATRDGITYIGDHGNKITGVDTKTGDVVYEAQGSRRDDGPGGIGIWTSILVDAEHSVYAGTRQGLIYGVRRDGRRLWTIDVGVTVDSYPALTADGALIFGTTGGDLLAIAES
ncbi:MAG: PQQ-binding-like beta-propeller repeat protein, partial [Aeromicrobium sp.]